MILINEYNVIAMMYELDRDEEDYKKVLDSINNVISRIGEVGHVKLSWYLSKLESFGDIRPLHWFVDIINKCAYSVRTPEQIDMIYYASFSTLNIMDSAKVTGNYLKNAFCKIKNVDEFLNSSNEDFGKFHIIRTDILKSHIYEYKL